MHQLFLKGYLEITTTVKYSFFRKYFEKNVDYCFSRPQVDVCSKCESFSIKLRDPMLYDSAKRTITAEQMIHKRRAKKFYTVLKEAVINNNDNTVAINQPLPFIPVQEVFYLRQLWVNVIFIHDLKTNNEKLYIYHERIANKSPDEVCSFLLHYINTLPPTVTKLLLFNDGAAGQNKNHTVVRFLMALCDTGRFDFIQHYFPVRGHSFLPCDRDYESIKRLIRRADRIYTHEQYGELFLRASRTERFTTHYVKTEEILAFKSWWLRIYKKTTISDEKMGSGIVNKIGKIS